MTYTRAAAFIPKEMPFTRGGRGEQGHFSRNVGGTLPRLAAPLAPPELPLPRRVPWAPLGLLQPCWNKGFQKKGASWRAKDSGPELLVSPAGRLK